VVGENISGEASMLSIFSCGLIAGKALCGGGVREGIVGGNN